MLEKVINKQDKTADDDITQYDGELNKEGQRHGQGTCYYKNDSIFIGSWFMNLPEGQGAK